MKRKNKVLIIAVAFIIGGLTFTNAQEYSSKYYLSFWGAAGYANLLYDPIFKTPDVKLINQIGGMGGLLGIGFEYQYKNFIITTGAEFDFKRSYYKFNSYDLQAGEIIDDGTGLPVDINDIKNGNIVGKPIIIDGMVDSDGDPFVMEYNFSKYSEVYNFGYVNIPLLMGAKFKNGIYFLAGGKFGINVIGFASESATFSGTGIYPQFMDVFGNMPQHNYGNDYKITGNNPFKLDYNITASLEIGKIMFFNSKETRWHYRLAVFADYGVGAYFGMNPNPKDGKNVLTNVVTDGSFIGIPQLSVANPNLIEPTQLQLNSLLTSTAAINNKFHPLLVGVKFTLLFDLGNKEPCNCLEDWNSKWQKRNRIK